jgi:hypothetical protein
MLRVTSEHPIERPGGLGRNRISGNVTVEIMIDTDGSVSCVRGVAGHPLGIVAAVSSLRKWTFEPYVIGGKAMPVLGVLDIPFDLSRSNDSNDNAHRVLSGNLSQRSLMEAEMDQSHETIQVDAEINSGSLSGIVTDPTGAVASQVLVERVGPGWGQRLSAVLSNTDGHFSFAGVDPGNYSLRISKPGFNTMLLKVRVIPQTRSSLQIELQLSH